MADRRNHSGSTEGVIPSAGQVVLWQCDLAALDRTELDRHLVLLSAEERQRYAAYLHREDRDRFLAGKALTRIVLGQCLSISPAGLTFASGPYGRPHLAADVGWRFNLSHSGDLVVLAVASSVEVGVDVENISRGADLDGIAGMVFKPSERAAMAALPEAARRRYFFRLWTLKEAFSKALGMGFSTDFLSFAVMPRDGGGADLAPPQGENAGDWLLCDVGVKPDYLAGVAVRHCRLPVRITGPLLGNELLKSFHMANHSPAV
jgi:4'-phosphopantetheinyl transferase